MFGGSTTGRTGLSYGRAAASGVGPRPVKALTRQPATCAIGGARRPGQRPARKWSTPVTGPMARSGIGQAERAAARAGALIAR
ncbi:hypothetical protein GCM10023195_74660 [Actinoallomurus liliacearum]|uniref:Uncharacterized protein n=1 Tax=Actinoallomurus liliacearum TaxID=1080073 RepID=A0ABP8TWT9_9ACTN